LCFFIVPPHKSTGARALPETENAVGEEDGGEGENRTPRPPSLSVEFAIQEKGADKTNDPVLVR